MSLRATTWALQVRGVPKNRRATLFTIADHHNGDTGQCNPSVARLAWLLECSERQVQYDLTWLEKHGLIRRSVHGTKGTKDGSTHYLLSLDRTQCIAPLSRSTFREEAKHIAPKPEEEPELEPQQAALTSSEEQEQQPMDAYEDIWGSAIERDAERLAKEKREEKERIARARKAALAALPRSQWRPGHLENFFRSQVTALSLPRQPQIDRSGLRGAFQALLVNGHRPEELAAAVESFCEDRTLWSDLVERQGAPIWKVFIKLAPTITTRRSPATSVAPATPSGPRNRLPGRRW